ncbi:SDR family NAD(P)-dependent oxidoreductase [Parvibacter caecicola]|uniref:3beta-hydroxycholanate 3-dehydrogenase (NAD(+)) n=1 Tax=Parvibacter caecicola TaxID=747645 RepID=A0A7W5D4K8_9ACTN|nr:3-oxoacyl-ACP reductase family protein [Parvibacter caecicola]MBB3172105.1 3-oxoacyl-[acyl-carrier protein] reductase/7-alpha-hydroxysteroid dehydrogenase [Parvibacter caecicola]MCR2041038.1 3-oxoacyl-ACP reductase FabG [Parvibacter caecicola]
MGIVEGKVAIVTGGTRGIGYSIVREFLKNGAKVALAGSRKETVDKAIAQLAEEGLADNVMGICPNLTSPDEVKEAFDAVVQRFGRLDVLCNNAGVSSRTPLVDYTLEEFEKVMALNVTAVFVCSQAAARIMIEQGTGGSVVNTSSMVGKYAQPSGCAYPTSKFAVNGLTLSLARELARHGIRVNAVAPGITHTDMVDALPESMIKPLIESIPLGRMGEPEDIACACMFLASDMSSYISGAVLPVDGLSRP